MTPVCTDAWMSTQDCRLLFSFETISLSIIKQEKTTKIIYPPKHKHLEFDVPVGI